MYYILYSLKQIIYISRHICQNLSFNYSNEVERKREQGYSLQFKEKELQPWYETTCNGILDALPADLLVAPEPITAVGRVGGGTRPHQQQEIFLIF